MKVRVAVDIDQVSYEKELEYWDVNFDTEAKEWLNSQAISEAMMTALKYHKKIVLSIKE